MIKANSEVQQIVQPIVGTVSQRRFNEEADEMEYLVSYKDENEELHSRWFLESQLEVKSS